MTTVTNTEFLSIPEHGIEAFKRDRLIRVHGKTYERIPLRMIEFLWVLLLQLKKHTESPSDFPTPEIEESEIHRRLKKIDDPRKPGFPLFAAAKVNVRDICRSKVSSKIRSELIKKNGGDFDRSGVFYSFKVNSNS